jgi:hypothetical protein
MEFQSSEPLIRNRECTHNRYYFAAVVGINLNEAGFKRPYIN